MQREKIKSGGDVALKKDELSLVKIEQERLKTTLKMFMSQTKTRFELQDRVIKEIKNDMKEIQSGIQSLDDRFVDLYEKFSERIHKLEIKVAKIMGGLSLLYVVYQILKGTVFK